MIAVFDFDKTVFSADLTEEFVKWRIRSSFVRIFLLFLCSPIIAVLLNMKKGKIKGINLINLIATAMNGKPLFRLRQEFITNIMADKKYFIYRDALQKIEEHQKEKDEIIILSASPKWLLYGFVKKFDLHPTHLIGSEQKIVCGALITCNFCHSENKLRMAQKAGLDPEKWEYGYTDNMDDIPFLRYCNNKILVNPQDKTLKKFRQCFEDNFESVFWT